VSGTDAEPAIVVEGLVKTYGENRAVDGLSFSVRRGEVFGLLGPNGAGKTTTIEILEGYRKPDAGRVSVLGLDPASQGEKLKPRIGAMLQEGGLYPAITPREALQLFGRFYPRSREVGELLRTVGLEGAQDVRYRRLSGGQKQRLSLALALVGRPDLAFLDEPTSGLDPQGRRDTWELISCLRDEGVTVLLSTHYLEEAERLADRVAILHHGKLLALDTPASLLQSDASIVRLRSPAGLDLRSLEALPSVESVRRDGMGAYLVETADAASFLAEVTAWCRDRGVTLTELRVGRASLEDVFLDLTGMDLEA
jgi:ABC-2 type transport system ATP-binding protein